MLYTTNSCIINYTIPMVNILDDKALEIISPTDALELAEELLEIQEDEKEVQEKPEGTYDEYHFGAKKWEEVINLK